MFTSMNVPYKLNAPPPLTVPSFRSIWQVEVNDQYQVVKPLGMEEPGLFLTYGGCGYLELAPEGAERSSHQMKPGSYVLLTPGIPCTYYCAAGETWSFYFIHYSDMRMIQELRLETEVLRNTKHMGYFLQRCASGIQTLIHRPVGYAYEVDLILHEILLRLAREQEQMQRTANGSVEAVLTWIHRNIGEPVDVDRLAEIAAMSRSVFYRMFKSVTGQTPLEYTVRLKLESAKIALETTNQTISAIAKSLGFYDEFHFSKTFKKRIGLSPSGYRAAAKP